MRAFGSPELPDSKIVRISEIGSGCFCGENVQIPDLPRFCRVEIESTPGSGSFIRSELWMPEDWNGIFIGLGNGGMAGGISHEALGTYIRQGYAAAHTDMGTSRGRESGIRNPDVWKDFGWRATHLMTVVSRLILKAWYGRSPDYAYFIGGSTGGQQALAMAQRFPEDYDGIQAGVPANNRLFLHTYFLWIHNHLYMPDGRILFTEDEVKRITDHAAAFFRAKGDGEAGDDFVTFPYQGAGTVAEFMDFLREKREYTEEQLGALRAIYDGPVNPRTGEQIYNGMPIGSESSGGGILAGQAKEASNFYPFVWMFGEDYDGSRFDFADDLDRISDAMSAQLNANDPDLTAFYRHGGKLLAFSGSADPLVPYPDAMKYYNRVCGAMGGFDTVQSFFRYFIFPGKDHGRNGRGANAEWSDEERHPLLYALRRWREKGIAPESLTAARVEVTEEGETVKFIRKILPYRADKAETEDFPKSCAERYLK